MKQKKISINLIWFINATIISIISWFTHKYDLTSLTYLLYNMLYIPCIFLLKKSKFEFDLQLRLLPFVISSILLVMVVPIFENDFYRYIWEGKVLLNGFNPYIYSPDNHILSNIMFLEKTKIGFPDLTTIYPPMALAIFAVSSIFSSSALFGIKILGMVNAAIIFYIFKNIKINNNAKFLLFLIFPLLAKEYINSVHIDLMAAFFIFLLILKKVPNKLLQFLMIVFSFFTKIFGLIYFFPFLLSLYKRNKQLAFLYTSGIFCSVFSYFYYLYLFAPSGGSTIFLNHWVWNAGFFSLLWRIGLEIEIARLISFAILVLSYLVVSFFSFVKLKDLDNFDRVSTELFVLFFCFLNFLMPVYNSWYAIWIAIPGVILGNIWVVMYAALSFLGYTYYFSESLVPLAEFLTHLWFIPSVVSLIKSLFLSKNIR